MSKEYLVLFCLFLSCYGQPSINLLGIGRNESNPEGLVFASMGTFMVSPANQTVDIKYGKPSSLYRVPGGREPCMNARLPWGSGIAYSIVTEDGYQIVGAEGTIQQSHIISNGSVVPWNPVNWAYNPILGNMIALGWTLQKSEQLQGRYMLAPTGALNGPPQLALINPKSGEMQSLIKIAGYAFLMCACSTQGAWFHYAYLANDNLLQNTMSFNWIQNKSYSVPFPMEDYGSINTLTHGGNAQDGVKLFVMTENDEVYVFWPQVQLISKITRLDSDYGTVVLGSAIFTRQSLFALIADSNNYSLSITTMSGTNQTTYLHINSSLSFEIGLFNLDLGSHLVQ